VFRAQHIDLLYDGLHAADDIVFKALRVDEQAQTAAIETRLRRFVAAQWADLARQAARQASEMLARGPGDTVRAGDVGRALAVVDRTMEQWPGRVTDRFLADMREAYRLARQSGFDRAMRTVEAELRYDTPKLPDQTVEKYVPKKPMQATVKVSFDLVDEAALDAFDDHQVFWIGQHYKGNVSPTIAAAAKEQVKAGMGRVAAGKEMRKLVEAGLANVSVPGGFRGTATSYFEGLVANATTVARATGHLRSFEKVGHNKYTVVNPGDHRTCETCNLLDGKEFYTKDGAALVGKVVGAKSPLGVKKVQPFLAPAKARALTGGKVGPAGPEKTGALVKSGNALPPFHLKCRCDVDITKDEMLLPFETDIGGGPKVQTPVFSPALLESKAKQLAKPKKVPKPTPKPKAAPVMEKPPPPTAPVSPEDSVAVVGKSEFPWEARQLKRTSRVFEGAHRKWSYKAPDGSEWLFKPVSEEFRAYGDEVAYRLGRELQVPQARLHVVTIDGQTGSIQRLFKNVTGDLKAGGGVPIESLTKRQAAIVQREHAFDWLIGNHDGHGKNLLLMKDGEIRGIDKGQLFKFYDKDKIAFTYNPNKAGFGEVSYYNQQFERYAKGEIRPSWGLDFNVGELQGFLKRVEDMPEEDFLAMLRPYSSRAAKSKVGPFAKWSEKRFLDAALRRKRGLRKTLEKFYDDLEKARREAAPAVREVAEAAPGKAVTPVNAELVRDVRKAGWAGKAVHVAGEDYEGMQFLTYGTNRRTILETKLRPVGDEKLLAFARRALGSEVQSSADEAWAGIERTMKSINFHLGPGGDGKLPKDTKKWIKYLSESYVKMPEGQVSAGSLEQFRYYKKELSRVIGSNNNVKKAGVGYRIQKWKARPQKIANLPAGAPKVTRVSTFDEGAKALRAGEIFEEAGVGNQFSGEVYEIDFGKGVKAVYVRHGDGNKFSKQGKLRLVVEKGVDKVAARDIQNAVDQLERLGLGSKLADKDDLELLYLVKVARAAGHEKAGKAAFLFNPAESTQKNIKRMKAAWEKSLKKKLTKAAGYEPIPTSEFLDGTGWNRWYRFDVDVDKLIKDDVGLYHSLYGGGTDGLEAILKGKTGALISTEEKYRIGIVPKGLSPGRDQSTGGASFTFTRLRTSENAEGALRFHPGILRDPDAIVYRSDEFGNVKESVINYKRQFGQAKIADIAKRGRANNETIFKNSISLERWLDEVKVTNEWERRRVVGWFKDAGITRVGPNRKPIEDAVVTTRTRLK